MLTYFGITQQGQSHIERGDAPCQDYHSARRVHFERLGCDLVLAAIADGVGDCEFSQRGAETAVNSFLECLEFNLTNKIPELSDDNMDKLLRHAFGYALTQVGQRADKETLPFLEYDSTLTGVIYDGRNLWFGHVGDDGIVALYSDSTYEMITERKKGEEARSLMPLRLSDCWQFGKAPKDVVSCVLMTDGVLDYCVDVEEMDNRIYFPFLEPALAMAFDSDEQAEIQRLDWEQHFAAREDGAKTFRSVVRDDITFLVVQNPDAVKALPPIEFDFDKWDEGTARKKELEKKKQEELDADFRAYKEGTYVGRTLRSQGDCPPAAGRPEKPPVEPEDSDGLVVDVDDADWELPEDSDTVLDGPMTDDGGKAISNALFDVVRSAYSFGRTVRRQIGKKGKKRQASPPKGAPTGEERAKTQTVEAQKKTAEAPKKTSEDPVVLAPEACRLEKDE